MDEEKRLITYFSHSELHTIGTTVEKWFIEIKLLFLRDRCV
jgi:hypothetical protein